jgi:NADPH-dependent glutamate synthase beta subunit-like oxidoreductase/NAD(P)H-flavin reductase
MLKLAFNLGFNELYNLEGIKKIDDIFLKELSKTYPDLYHNLIIARTELLEPKAESKLIIELAPILEDFIAELFAIKSEVKKLAESHNILAPIYSCKRLFVQRQAVKSYNPEESANIDIIINKLDTLGVNVENELQFAVKVNEAEGNTELLELARIYAGWATCSIEGQKKHKNDVLFKTPKKLDIQNLLPINKVENSYKSEYLKERHGFNLTDEGFNLTQALDQANYCINCHNQLKDSCSHGFKDKDSNTFKTNELNVKLAGCPLEEKISEMNLLKSNGSVIGAFATAVIDNPMIAATGHRICNDCMKACIYQKQEPVNIPMVETQVLKDVLHLPWGFEIYSLLTKWNPLNFKNYLPKEQNNHKVLVVGQGPAGFTLAHYLANEGFIVTAIDGLKIEPLPDELVGNNFIPIKNIEDIFEDLDSRTQYGFGGVVEYGITVRWDKNYLKVIRLLLERRNNYKLYGGIRFGGTINYTSAFELGFDHIALAIGAGKPNILDIPNALARGVRTASDFLMSLQLSGAAKSNSISNLQIRLPVTVIGGGLTAIDTATESLAYYQVQVEKFLKRYEQVGDQFFNSLTEEESILAKEFIHHAEELRKAKGIEKIKLLQSWGGVKVLYRKTLQDSPAYRLNHEEIDKALEEGIEFIENITPTSINTDKFGACESLTHKNGTVPAKTIFIAAGTSPNTVLAREDEKHFILDGNYFRTLDENGNVSSPEKVSKPEKTYILTSLDNSRTVSFLGDSHPSFVGNVVKAMGSAKQGYPIISKIISKNQPNSDENLITFYNKLDNLLIAKIVKIKKLTPNILEIVIKAKLASKEFQPGQFYRFQNYEKNSIQSNNTKLNMEGIALTGAWVDKEKGLISTIVLEMGGSSDLCQYLKPDEEVVLMGPTGTPTEILENKTVMLIGGGLGNAVLFSIGKALKENNCKVVYFAGYKKLQDRYKIEEIEQASDVIVWCCDEGVLPKNRNTDFSFHGNIVEAIKAYAMGQLGDISIDTQDIDRMIVIGSDRMMKAVAFARHNDLKQFLKKELTCIASINSPMQCMMKEICGQCIQRHVDPNTKQESYIYSCFNQDQEADLVDFEHLHARLTQNSLQEKMTAKWIKHCLSKAA